MDCVICSGPIKPLLHPTTGEVVWAEGNNAEPVSDGRCCDDCNWMLVIPKRFDNVLGARHELDADAIRKQMEARRGWGVPYTDQEAYDHENPPPLEDPMDREK